MPIIYYGSSKAFRFVLFLSLMFKSIHAQGTENSRSNR